MPKSRTLRPKYDLSSKKDGKSLFVIIFFTIFASPIMKKLLTVILTLLTLTTSAQTLHFHQLTVKDGLPRNSVITLAQDAKGDIWVATHGGLCIYDGRKFTTLPSDELPDRRVDRINRSADGTMWVQCFEHHKQVSRYDTLTHHFVTYDVQDLSDSVRQQVVLPLNRTFADHRSPRVWTIEKRQLWQTDTLKANSAFAYTGQTALDAGLKDEVFYSLLLDSDGILWAGSANNGLFFADTRLSHYRRLVCQPTPMTRLTCTDRKGTLWIAISDQQLLTLPKAATYSQHIDYPMTDSVEGRRARAIVEDNKGRLWLGTQDGLYMKDATASDFIKIDMGKKELTAVYSLCKDENGLLWIGTNHGLFRLVLDKEPKAEQVDSIPTLIGDIAVEGRRLWIASESGLYCRADNKTVLWSKDASNAVITDGRGHTWVGAENGLFRVTEQGLEPIAIPEGLVIKDVKDLICWRDFLWCSYNLGLCCVNIYTGQVTAIHTDFNEYTNGSASLDPQTGTLFFGGTLGIDCLQADSLDEKLRSGIPQIWLQEVRQEVSPQPVDKAPTTGYYWLSALLIVLGGATFYYYKKRKKEDLTQEVANEVIEEEKEPTPFVLKAKAITEAHIGDANFTAEQLAQEMAMSRSKLFLLMKKETGKAVMEFVRDIRLDYAAQLLADGVPVADIAMACGFSDPSSFRRSFAKKFGLNPSQYREHHSTKYSKQVQKELVPSN